MGSLLLLLLVLLWYPLRLLTTLLHELGHALMAILITRDRVIMYVGSYGGTNNNITFRTGLLDWRIRYNIFHWKGGMCVVNTTFTSSKGKVLFIAAGPVFPFIVAVTTFAVVYALGLHQSVWVIAMVFCLITFFLMFHSLTPSPNPIELPDGSITYNDGEKIRRIVNDKEAEVMYDQGGDYYREGKYKAAIPYFEQGLISNPESKQMYQLLIDCYIQTKEYAKAKQVAERCVLHCKALNELLNFLIADVYLKLKEYERALHYYNEVLKINPENIYSWYNKGATLCLLQYYTKAIPCFTKAISLDAGKVQFHNGLALAKIRLDNLEEAALSINRALRLDGSNASVYRTLGIYHLKKQQHAKAYEAFMEAKARGYDGTDLEALLIEARNLTE